MSNPWKRLKHKLQRKKDRYDVSLASNTNGISLMKIQKYDSLQTPFTSQSPTIAKENGSIGNMENQPIVSVPSSEPSHNTEKGHLIGHFMSRSHKQTKVADKTNIVKENVILNGSASDDIAMIFPEKDSNVNTQPNGIGHVCNQRVSYLDDDFDEDPAYSTLDEVKKEIEIEQKRKESNEKPNRSSSDSGMGSPGVAFDARHHAEVFVVTDVFGEVKSGRTSADGRNSASEFPTYDNWMLKKEAKDAEKVISNRISGIESRSDNKPDANVPINTAEIDSEDDLYAVPENVKQRSHTPSLDSLDGGVITEANDVIGDLIKHHEDNDDSDAPPIPKRGYERTNSILEIGSKDQAVKNINVIDALVATSATEHEATVSVIPYGPTHQIKTGGPHTAVVHVGGASEDVSLNNIKCINVETNKDTSVLVIESPEPKTVETAAIVSEQISPVIELAVSSSFNENASPKNVEEDQDDADSLDGTVPSPCPVPTAERRVAEEPTHMTMDELLESAHQQGLSLISEDKRLSGDKGKEHDLEMEKRKCIESLNYLKDCGWYWGPLSALDAESKLENKPDGAFLVRDSSDDCYILSLTFKSLREVRHTRIEHHKGKFSFYSQPKSHECGNIKQFIENAMMHSQNHRFLYFTRPRGPGNPPIPVSLLHPVSRFKTMRSLQHMCRFAIKRLVRLDHIDKLPLPTNMKNYMKEEQYYIEFIEDM